jgi:phospholipid/cholesterol/gamma-HCH transport system permease protein
MGKPPVIEQENGGEAVIYLRGRFDHHRAGPLWREVTAALEAAKPPRLILDFQDLSGIDTAGAAFLFSLESLCDRRLIKITRRHLAKDVAQFLGYLQERWSGRPLFKQQLKLDPISQVGKSGWENLQDAYAFVRFLGEFLAAGVRLLLKPGRLHVTEVLYQIKLAGVGAVPLLVTLSLLLGSLMVFQGMNTVSNFGAVVLIADMVAVSVSKEMGPLLTAVILAGRSGAGFAAEIGTMKISEEVDALTVLNFDIVTVLAWPRVLALVIAGPLLTMIADASGILGGLVCSRLVLNLPMISFLEEARKVLSYQVIYSGLIKGCVFGGSVAFIGCFRGLTTGLGAGSVGVQTTSAVVTAIFVVIFLDTVFSYIFQVFNW